MATRQQIERIFELYRAGFSNAEIARIAGVSTSEARLLIRAGRVIRAEFGRALVRRIAADSAMAALDEDSSIRRRKNGDATHETRGKPDGRDDSSGENWRQSPRRPTPRPAGAGFRKRPAP